MKRKYGHVLAAFYSTAWMILPGKLREIEAILWRRIEGGQLSSEERTEKLRALWEANYRGLPKPGTEWVVTVENEPPAAAFDDGAIATDNNYKVVGGAAILPIHGTIT